MRALFSGSFIRRTRPRHWLAAVLAVFLSLAPVSGACTQQEPYVKTAQTVLLICTGGPDNSLRSAYLMAIGQQRVGLLPLPGATRAQQTQTDEQGASVQLYAPLAEAYRPDAEDPIDDFRQSVRFLLSGTPIDTTIVFSAADIVRLTDLLGGVSFSITELPAVPVFDGGQTGIYPQNDDNDPMALLLRRTILQSGLTPGYDLDLGRALRRGGTLPERILLSGQEAGMVFDYFTEQDAVNVNLPMLHRQQQILLALLQAAAKSPQTQQDLWQDGSPLAALIAGFCQWSQQDLMASEAILPDGYLLASGPKDHWVFDSTWLRSWIFDNIYAQPQDGAAP